MTREVNSASVLCDRLSARFEHRGVKNPAVMNRVALQREEEITKRKNEALQEKRKKEYKSSRIEPGFTSAKRRIAGAEYRRRTDVTFDVPREFVPDGGRFGLAYAKGQRIRARAASFNPAAYERYNPQVVAARAERERAAERKNRKSFGKILGEKISSVMPRFSDAAPEEGERVLKKKPIPKGVVAGILLCTVLLLTVLYTFATYTQVVADGKALQQEKVELLMEKSRVVNLLEVRDDVREIEDYATNTIGMVKSDLVETRHVSIAGGERIEIIKADETEEGGGFFSNILSAMGSNWNRLLEYFD